MVFHYFWARVWEVWFEHAVNLILTPPFSVFWSALVLLLLIFVAHFRTQGVRGAQ